jgi:hypothetical protein
MQPNLSTTPFGRRPLTLAMVAGQVVAKACPPKAAVHKRQVHAICEGRAKNSERLERLFPPHPRAESASSYEKIVEFACLPLTTHSVFARASSYPRFGPPRFRHTEGEHPR